MDIQKNNAAAAAFIQSDFNKIVKETCELFMKISGGLASPTRDASALAPFYKEFNWKLNDFRLLIEYELTNRELRAYLEQPGKMNLRTIFNLNRKERLLDVHADLKRSEEIKEKHEAILKEKGESPDVKTTSIIMACGCLFRIKHLKVPDPSIPKGYRWKRCENNENEYAKHFCVGDDQASCITGNKFNRKYSLDP